MAEKQLQEALLLQKEKGGRLSEILIALGFVNERDLKIALSKSLEIPPINLDRIKVDKTILALIPERVARFYQVVPLSKIKDIITVAMADPLNIFALDDIKSLTGFKVKVVVATQEEILRVINQAYSEGAKVVFDHIVQNIKETELEMISDEGGEEEMDAAALMRLIEETPVVKVTNLIFSNAVKKKASDVMIEPLEEKVRVRFRLDGILQEQEVLPKMMHHGIISRIKVIANLNIAERRIPQDGRFKARILGREVDFRVSVLPSILGEKIVLRVLDKSNVNIDIDKLGFDGISLALLKGAASRPHGMILICGPTGCGKTTTLYAILRLIHKPESNLVTVEDPVEYQIEGVNQVTANPDIGLTFAAALRSILRQDPNIVMVGEMRDFETVDIGIKSALTGHLVLSTLHTTDAPGSIVRLINMGIEPFLITSSVILVAAQRLVRILCENCKEQYEAAEALKRELYLPKEKKVYFYRPKGCSACHSTGYRGRTCIIETMMLTPRVKDLIMHKSVETQIKREARLGGMKTLRENGLLKAIEGITSLEEILRVAGADEPLG